MARKLEGRIVVATHNSGKLREMRELLAPYGIAAVSAGELGLGVPDETASDFIGNALIKAEAAAKATGLPALADDSGLCVDGLNGDPGIYSADWAIADGDYYITMARIDGLLLERGCTTPQTRCAHFVSTLAIVWPDGHQEVFEGKVFGAIVAPPRGTAGFGYDPCFLPDDHARTFGEMTSDEKHGIPPDGSQALSHRARAFQMLAAACLAKG